MQSKQWPQRQNQRHHCGYTDGLGCSLRMLMRSRFSFITIRTRSLIYICIHSVHPSYPSTNKQQQQKSAHNVITKREKKLSAINLCIAYELHLNYEWQVKIMIIVFIYMDHSVRTSVFFYFIFFFFFWFVKCVSSQLILVHCLVHLYLIHRRTQSVILI